jgi:ABC-type microcin C transport system permease subunit YejB
MIEIEFESNDWTVQIVEYLHILAIGHLTPALHFIIIVDSAFAGGKYFKLFLITGVVIRHCFAVYFYPLDPFK